MTQFTILRSQVRPGDVLIDAIGRPFFRVTEVHQARAKGYLVFFGDNLVPGRDGQAGGHRSDTVTVERS